MRLANARNSHPASDLATGRRARRPPPVVVAADAVTEAASAANSVRWTLSGDQEAAAERFREADRKFRLHLAQFIETAPHGGEGRSLRTTADRFLRRSRTQPRDRAVVTLRDWRWRVVGARSRRRPPLGTPPPSIPALRHRRPHRARRPPSHPPPHRQITMGRPHHGQPRPAQQPRTRLTRPPRPGRKKGTRPGTVEPRPPGATAGKPALAARRKHQPGQPLRPPNQDHETSRLTPIPGAGQSHGANLLANPTLDLADLRERELQLDDWLQQIALDAGLSGMEDALGSYHQKHATG
jgi:hypothetical protein